MDTLIKNLQAGDRAALRELFAIKGFGVYKSALEHAEDREAAKQATREVFLETFRLLIDNKEKKLVESALDALLFERTKYYCGVFNDLGQIQRELFGDPALAPPPRPADPFAGDRQEEPFDEAPQESHAAPVAEPEAPQPRRKRKQKPPKTTRRKRGFFYGLSISLLSLCVLLFIWFIAGIVMEIGYLPNLDLGYTWFNRVLFPLF